MNPINVYLVTNKNNGKIYVGQTRQKIRNRWTRHVYDASKGWDIRFHRAIRKHGAQSFAVRLLETLDTKLLGDTRERWWIAFYDTTNPRFGYNSTTGGEGGVHDEATRHKIGNKAKAWWQNPDNRIRASKSRKGFLVGPRNPMYGKGVWSGRKHTDETKAKLSIASKKRWTDAKYRNNFIATMTGRTLSKERCAAISASLVGNQYRKGIPHSQEVRARIAESVHRSYVEGRHRNTGGGTKGIKFGPMPEAVKQRISATMKRVRQERPWITRKSISQVPQ